MERHLLLLDTHCATAMPEVGQFLHGEEHRDALARLGMGLAWCRDEAGTIAGSTYALPGYRGPMQSRPTGRALGGACSWARVAAYLEHGCAPGAIRALARGEPYPDAGMAVPGVRAPRTAGTQDATGTGADPGIGEALAAALARPHGVRASTRNGENWRARVARLWPLSATCPLPGTSATRPPPARRDGATG